MFLLDTNVVSELRTGKRAPSKAVLAWAAGVRIDDQFVSAVTMYELEVGVRLIEHRDARQGAVLRAWLAALRGVYASRILAIDDPVAARAARLQVPDPIPAMDALIAATALLSGLTVVTRNVADFARTGVAVLDPWS